VTGRRREARLTRPHRPAGTGLTIGGLSRGSEDGQRPARAGRSPAPQRTARSRSVVHRVVGLRARRPRLQGRAGRTQTRVAGTAGRAAGPAARHRRVLRRVCDGPGSWLCGLCAPEALFVRSRRRIVLSAFSSCVTIHSMFSPSARLLREGHHGTARAAGSRRAGSTGGMRRRQRGAAVSFPAEGASGGSYERRLRAPCRAVSEDCR